MSALQPTSAPAPLTLNAFYSQVRQEGFDAVYQRLWQAAQTAAAVGVYLSLRPLDSLQADLQKAQAGLDQDPLIWHTKPLWGVPFSVKDNIDVAGLPTTAACPGFAYQPQVDAAAVARLRAAGALVTGKTNLDQFATGLVGLRTPFPVPLNPLDPATIPGGSSSGSAVSVSLGLVCFSLGTDTAGSGRVPAALQGLWGVKPTPGLVSTAGVVPACRSLDCVSVFTSDPADAALVLEHLQGFDPADPYSRPLTPPAPAPALPTKILIPLPEQLDWFGDTQGPTLWTAALERWHQLGVPVVPTDFTPFFDTAALLYQGPWIAERTAALEDFLTAQPQSLHPVTAKVLATGRDLKATEVFRAQWKLQALRRTIDGLLPPGTAALAPTLGRPFTVAEVQAEPLARNTDLGRYTNFMNLAGLAAVTYPAGRYSHGPGFGLTLFAGGGSDPWLLHWLGTASTPVTPVFVCGAHLSGLPLNHQLTSRGAVLAGSAQTAPEYKLYLLPPPPVPRPSLVRVTSGGTSIAGEIWLVPDRHLGSFLAGIPSPLGLGKVKLDTGAHVVGFLGETWATEGRPDLSEYGGWRAWLASSGKS